MREVINRQKNVIFNTFEVLKRYLDKDTRSIKDIPLVDFQQYVTSLIAVRPDGNNIDEQYENLAIHHDIKKIVRLEQEKQKEERKQRKMLLFQKHFGFTFDPYSK